MKLWMKTDLGEELEMKQQKEPTPTLMLKSAKQNA